MAAETGFIIDGTLYEIPGLDTFTMDEAQILYDYSGLTLEDFVGLAGEEDADAIDPEDVDTKFKNPGLLRAMMHVAYQRANPKANSSRVKTLIGSANLINALEHLADVGQDDASPPALTTEPNESSQKSSVGSSESSGTASEDDTAAPVVPLVPTTGGSSPPLVSTPTISAV